MSSGVQLNEPIAQFELGTERNFVYLVLDWNTLKAAIVDPQKDLTVPLGALKTHGFTLTAILLTHSHSDHTAGVPELLESFPGLPVFAHAAERKRLRKFNIPSFKPLNDGSIIEIGELRLETLHTPGHSAGACSYFLRRAGGPSFLLTGDTVFIQDCGRTDLDTGNNEDMFHSLRKIAQLDAESKSIVILPGHHYATACTALLSTEIRTSPCFQCKSVEELARLN
ncbi:MAG TPA: MBL fold metallo-hydrolase [Bdellovibrionota bacterium]|nr:MBL fold metallo-hydrolase [Bdellovibrionota bacterium]